MLFSVLLNLSTIHEWLSQKEASAMNSSFLKLTSALNDIGNEFYLNFFRDSVRLRFLNKQETASVGSEISPLKPELVPEVPRKVAAIEGISSESIVTEEDLSELDVIDELIDDPAPFDEFKKDVLIVGDSILRSGLQEHIQRNLGKRNQSVQIEIKSKSGTGLARPDVFDWINYLEKTKTHFEKIVVFLGTNDAQNIVLNKKVIRFDTDEWNAEYGFRIRNFIQKACGKAKQVYWVGSLRMRSKSFDAKMQSLQAIARKEIKNHPSCARFIPVSQWFSKKSKYTDTWTTDSKKTGKKTIKLRVADGIHLTYWGADLFSQKLIESIYE